MEDHPPPDLAGPLALDDPAGRIEAVLLALHGYYRETDPMRTALDAEAAAMMTTLAHRSWMEAQRRR